MIALRSLFRSCRSSPFIVPRVALRLFGWMVSCRACSTALIASLYVNLYWQVSSAAKQLNGNSHPG
ncbi:hypothetical protein ADK51_22900 [Streptomyces sp. WM6368]|nr:hypothetical protein ADK51_22900 [Streptomyces sp. WM6368]